MITVFAQSGIGRTQDEASRKMRSLVRQGKRLGLLRIVNGGFGGEHGLLEDFREELTHSGGQYLSLDFARCEGKSLAESVLEELAPASTRYPLRYLPLIRSESPFMQRAITWQRLCDRLIEDEEPSRPTLLVIENFEQADEQTRCDVERLIHFHITHNIRRTFLLAIQNEDHEFLRPSLSRLVNSCIVCCTQNG